MLYFVIPSKFLTARNAVLLVSSLLFYGWGEPKYVFLMIGTILLFYICGLLVEKAKTQHDKKSWMVLSVFVSLAILFVFKYFDFFITNINAVTGLAIPLLKIALPVGISFYTFQCLSYVIDVYRGNVPAQKNIISFGAYVTMFPQLIAGPIVRYSDIAKELNSRTHSVNDFVEGLRRFAIGLAKKILIANQMGAFVSIFRASDEKSVLFFWLYAIAFAIQIYFDFSGYSDMAIGLGRIFGFHFIENFNYPYLSKSVTEFWRRWHMSLGSWFRDYVYIPCGGSRVSKGRHLFNIFLVWMLTGLWHGAAWNFILWGLMYALLLMMEKNIPSLTKQPKFMQLGRTLLITLIGFMLFNATSFTEAWTDVVGLIAFWKYPIFTTETLYYAMSYASIFVAGIIGATPLMKNLWHKAENSKKLSTMVHIVEPILIAASLIICTSYLIDGSFNPFLYFRF